MKASEIISETRLFPTHTVKRYMDGYCDSLARALHEKTKLPIVVFLGDDNYFSHAFIGVNSDMGLDIKGLRPISEIEREFSRENKKYNCKPTIMTPEEFNTVISVIPSFVQEAMPIADILIREYL